MAELSAVCLQYDPSMVSSPAVPRSSNAQNLIRIPCKEVTVDNKQSQPEYFNNFLPSLFLSNTRSLENKIEDLQVVINNLDADIVCVTETWLSNNISDSVVDIKDYALVRKDRATDKRGGGVCVFIKTSFAFITFGGV